MRKVKFAVIKDGNVIRHGVCQESTLALQAKEGETCEVFDESKHSLTKKEKIEIPAHKIKERDLYALVPLLMESIVDESKKTELIDAINKVLK